MSIQLEEVYIYSVSPRRPLVLKDGTCVKVPKSLYLSKEDLYNIVGKNAVVYRRFIEEGINERVTIDSIERLHRANYIPENEWKGEATGTVVDTTPVTAPVTDEVKEDNKEEVNIADTIEEKVDPIPVDEESVVEEEAQEESKEVNEDVVEVKEKVNDKPQKQYINKNNNYKNKK